MTSLWSLSSYVNHSKQKCI